MLQRLLLGTATGKTMLVLFVAGIFLRMITVVSYKKMKRAAENAGNTKKQWVQVLKKRFDNYERFGRVRDVTSFVEHYFSRKGIFGIPLAFWDRSVLFLSLFTMLLGIGSSYLGYVNGGAGNVFLEPVYLGSFFSVCLLIVHNFGATKEIKESIRVTLTDYLANGTSQRIKDYRAPDEKEEIPAKEEVEALSEAAVTEEEKQVLMDVLEDYFW